MSDMRLVVVGAAGRMGRMLVSALHSTNGVVLAGALEHKGSIALGQDAGLLAGCGKMGINITDDPVAAFSKADGVIDFSNPETTISLSQVCAKMGIAHIVGTTGLSESDVFALEQSARRIAVVRSGNMSLGVNVLAVLVERVARALPDFDIEIVEMHHRMKVDAPSGTALLLGEAAAQGRSMELKQASVRVRDGHTGPRPDGAIGFATLRGGTVVGDHSVIFAGNGERVELVHKAEDRSIFAEGAVRAALWARGKEPGIYSMRDVLGI